MNPRVPPGPSPERPLPPEVARDPLATFVHLREAYGDVVAHRGPNGPYVAVYDPALVKAALTHPAMVRATLLEVVVGESTLSADGEPWRRHRRVVQPLFEKARVEAHIQLMRAEAEAEREAWVGRSAPFDMEEAMMRLTLRVVARAMFSTELGDRIGVISGALTEAIRGLSELNEAMLGIPVRVSPSRNRRFREATRALDEVVAAVIQGRRARPVETWPDDLLSVLLRSGDADGGGLDAQGIRDEVITMLVAGHETTAGMLTWTWARLACHPEVQERWRGYLSGLPEGPPELERLVRRNPTSALLMESMRLHPPVWLIARKVRHTVELEGFRFDEGTVVCVPVHALHRHPRWWAEPERFDPDRFDEGAPAPERFAYVPFARGAHQCLGQHFALLEGQILLETLGRRFRAELVTPGLPAPLPLVTLRVKGGLPVRVHPV